MTKLEKLKEFIESKIKQIDNNKENIDSQEDKINLAIRRVTFSNILSSYLGVNTQLYQSYLYQAQVYSQLQCYDQAISSAKISIKKIIDIEKDTEKIQKSQLLIIKCLIAKGKYDEAKDYLEKLKIVNNQEEYYSAQAQVMSKLNKQNLCFQMINVLENKVIQKYGKQSIQYGMQLIKKGRYLGYFKHEKQAIEEMLKGINLLIDHKCKDISNIYQIYMDVAQLQRAIFSIDQEYSSLICAQAMIRQLPNTQKKIIQVSRALARNYQERGCLEKALNEYIKIQKLQKQVYGQSSHLLNKTLKNIIYLLYQLGRKNQAKRYQQQYSRLFDNNFDVSLDKSIQKLIYK